jgi:hypothetical protein
VIFVFVKPYVKKGLTPLEATAAIGTVTDFDGASSFAGVSNGDTASVSALYLVLPLPRRFLQRPCASISG